MEERDVAAARSLDPADNVASRIPSNFPTLTSLYALGHTEHGGRHRQPLVLLRLAVVVVAQLARPRGDVVSVLLPQTRHTVQGSHADDVLFVKSTAGE